MIKPILKELEKAHPKTLTCWDLEPLLAKHFRLSKKEVYQQNASGGWCFLSGITWVLSDMMYMKLVVRPSRGEYKISAYGKTHLKNPKINLSSW